MNIKENVTTLETEVEAQICCIDEDRKLLLLDMLGGPNQKEILKRINIPTGTKSIMIEFNKPNIGL